MVDEASATLWRPSPCVLGFASTQVSFERSARFKLFSIYAKDDVNKQKKVFNDIEKPQLLLQHFRREIQEASSNRFKRANRNRLKSLANNRRIHNQTISTEKPSMSTTVTNRLYWPQPKISMDHDFFGNRSHFTDNSTSNLEIKEKENPEDGQQIKKKGSYIFTEAKRLDLAKPLNFVPGPGSYEFDTAYLRSDPSIKSGARFRSKSSFRTTQRTITEMKTVHE